MNSPGKISVHVRYYRSFLILDSESSRCSSLGLTDCLELLVGQNDS
ncbi:hypothetical protein SLEP1_g35469 [Rubroshorea leprosula]|uniref:Uncharacterized protein n=1 Tax=Rubroshorea leprosula TaxID=152421 RepID=A0AAV5KNL4_9ROSI|nr:hypothetical protein SLEP1_g35469 [Rubroshorea leprosula]